MAVKTRKLWKHCFLLVLLNSLVLFFYSYYLSVRSFKGIDTFESFMLIISINLVLHLIVGVFGLFKLLGILWGEPVNAIWEKGIATFVPILLFATTPIYLILRKLTPKARWVGYLVAFLMCTLWWLPGYHLNSLGHFRDHRPHQRLSRDCPFDEVLMGLSLLLMSGAWVMYRPKPLFSVKSKTEFLPAHAVSPE